MRAEKSKLVIISLGGTPAPLIFSLDRQRPDYICFFVSKESKESIDRDILPNLGYKPRHYDWILSESAEDLNACYSAIYRALPTILNKWGVDPSDLIVDYTGGTKTMSVALALATIDQSSSYTYVGGVERTKEGVGVVLNGKEKIWYQANPWDEIALSERKEACLLFNKAFYSGAARTFKKIADKVTDRARPFFEALQNMAEGYDLWDKFDHKNAKAKLFKVRAVIDACADVSCQPNLLALSEAIAKSLAFLDKMERDPNGKMLLQFYDLLANAKRRANLEGKFDDAVARLYRALEAIAQYKLKACYGVDTSQVKEQQIPSSLRDDFVKKYTQEESGKIKLPLYASYLMLNELNDELGASFFRRYDTQLKSLLNLRNSSILAHGLRPMKKEDFEKLYPLLLELAKIQENEIPEFPVLTL